MFWVVLGIPCMKISLIRGRTNMSKWDYLDDEFESYDNFQPIRKNGDPEGSLTDNLRLTAPRRNGAHKRVREMKRKMKEYMA